VDVNQVSSQKTIEQIINDAAKAAQERKSKSELGKDEFLKLLVTQLQYQDPLEPMKDTDFIAQMAQFSALEQMQNLNNTFSAMKGFNLIGKYIMAQITNESTGQVEVVQGVVSSVKMSGSKITLVVDDKDISIEDVTEVMDYEVKEEDEIDEGDEIGEDVSESRIISSVNLIGCDVKAYLYNSETDKFVGVSGNVSGLAQASVTDLAILDNVNVAISEIIADGSSNDPDFMYSYLEENLGKEIQAVIKDNHGEVAVYGVLESFNIDEDGNVTAVFDKMLVPLDNIYSVMKPENIEE